MNIGELSTVKTEPAKAKVTESGKLNDNYAQQTKHTSVDSRRTDASVANEPKVSERADIASLVLTKRISSELRVERGSIDGSLRDDDQSENKVSGSNDAKPTDEQGSVRFDFETVARNVMGFISKTIQQRADAGATDDQLQEKIDQARKGIENGFKSALNDLGGLIDNQIEEDIGTARNIIDFEINSIESSLLNNSAVSSTLQGTELNKQNTSDLQIRTKDGDLVSISLDKRNDLSYVSQTMTSANASSVRTEFSQTSSQNFNISVSGELDKAELDAISALVGKVDELASQYFYGDIEKAYESSMALGFDNEQLSGFALQLKQTESYSKLRQYGEVQYGSKNDVSDASNNQPKSVAQYMNKMLDVMDQSSETLEGAQDYKTIINGLINEMKDVQVPDLLTAINNFHRFTAKLGLTS